MVSSRKRIANKNDASINKYDTLNLTAPTTKDENPDVNLSVNTINLAATLDNGLIKITFKNDATVSSLYKNDKNLVENVAPGGSFYLDWHNGTYHRFSPTSLQVIRNSTEHAHIMYLQNSPGFLRLEYHIIMTQGLSGIYTYIKFFNIGEKPLNNIGVIRIVYRFNVKVMHQVTNGVLEGVPPLEKELNRSRIVQDTTWKLANGSIYSKYDYAGYLRKTPYQGVFGHGSGAWLLSASREYHCGGPLKQENLVHQEATILSSMTGSHFGTPSLTAPPGWSKLYGPWLLYFNEGSDNELKKDAISQSKLEQLRWPYKWMNELDYPLKRGLLTGQITGPTRSMAVLSSSLKEKFDVQVLGYSYSSETDKNGTFILKNIKPGTYKLTAYPIEGYGIGFESEKLITITEGMNRVSLELSVPTKVKWSIGETNRKSDSYRYSNESRSYIWHTLPPANLEFQIGKSNIHTDWYYAQTQPGTWTVRYNDTPNGLNRILRIGIAAASNIKSTVRGAKGFPILSVNVNGHLMNEFQYKNDRAIYRGALQSGNFHAETVIIPANLVIKGDNRISLTLREGSVMYDSINLSDIYGNESGR